MFSFKSPHIHHQPITRIFLIFLKRHNFVVCWSGNLFHSLKSAHLVLNFLPSLVAANHDIDVYAELVKMSSGDFMLLQMRSFHAFCYRLRRQSVGGRLIGFFRNKSLRCGRNWSSGMDLMCIADLASLCGLD